jgi:hypothetical protein
MEKVITGMQDALRAHLGDWEEDGSEPANLVRKDGMGLEIARVDRWCGGYQSPHEPIIIGWRVRRGSSLQEGAVETWAEQKNGEPQKDVARAIEEAKRLTDEAYRILYGKEDS